jgi:hypothetical protein
MNALVTSILGAGATGSPSESRTKSISSRSSSNKPADLEMVSMKLFSD